MFNDCLPSKLIVLVGVCQYRGTYISMVNDFKLPEWTTSLSDDVGRKYTVVTHQLPGAMVSQPLHEPHLDPTLLNNQSIISAIL